MECTNGSTVWRLEPQHRPVQGRPVQGRPVQGRPVQGRRGESHPPVPQWTGGELRAVFATSPVRRHWQPALPRVSHPTRCRADRLLLVKTPAVSGHPQTELVTPVRTDSALPERLHVQ